MANVERFQNHEGQNVLEMLALFLAKKIRREDLSENNQTILSYYIGLMDDNPDFTARVNFRTNQLIIADGEKIPLYSPDEIKKLAKHKRRKKREDEFAFQPGLWQDKPIPNNETYGFENIIDPEKKLFKLGKDLDSRFYRYKDSSLIRDEITEKRLRLRSLIGLPVVRGKDPHVGDKFYKFLVNRVCNHDAFGIFNEYDRVLDEIPQELDSKIKQVGGLVDELLNKNLGRPQRFRIFNQFVQEYRNR